MVTVSNIFDLLDMLAPVKTKMDFDNVGLLVGSGETPVKTVLVALDVTDEVIEEAINIGAQLIVSHHPIFFSLKSVTDADPIGRKVLRLASSGISAICMHTNLDAAEGGVNDTLAEVLGLTDVLPLTEPGEDIPVGRYGIICEQMNVYDFAALVKDRLNAGCIRYTDSGRPVRKVAVLGGSGGSSLRAAMAHGCDTFLTADVKYDVFLSAYEAQFNLIDGGHFCTENVIVPVIKNHIAEAFSELNVIISAAHGRKICYL